MSKRGPKAERPAKNARQEARREARKTEKRRRREEATLSALGQLSFMRKLDRASQHIESIERAVQDWALDGYRTTTEMTADGVTTHYAALVRPLPDQLPLLIGDASQCLYNSLDHLAFALAAAHKGTLTNTEEKNSAFPIDEKPRREPSGKWKVDSRIACWQPCAEAVSALLQPYLASNGLVAHPLWRLRDLANRDKHREIQTAVFGYSVNEMSMGNGYIAYFQTFGAQQLTNELTPLLAYSQRNYGDLRLRASFDLRFGDGPLVQGQDVVQTLRSFEAYIKEVAVKKLAKYL